MIWLQVLFVASLLGLLWWATVQSQEIKEKTYKLAVNRHARLVLDRLHRVGLSEDMSQVGRSAAQTELLILLEILRQDTFQGDE